MNSAAFRILRIVPSLALVSFVLTAGCTVPSTSTATSSAPAARSSEADTQPASQAAPETTTGGAMIPIEANGPADTVRVFYKHLREKRFREAIFLTNLRPAFEGLTDSELKDFALDFAALAGQVPAEIQINGEIVSGENATVTANLPGEEDKIELQTIKLKKAGDVWIIQTADEAASKQIAKEGKKYFYNLRIKTHEEEARKMLERISKAQLAHAYTKGGTVASIDELIAAGFLPDDVRTSESTGYVYSMKITPDKKSYSATATPAEYGKSGNLSFVLKPDGKGMGRVSSRDNGGKPLEN
jgi:hypothetical protein